MYCIHVGMVAAALVRLRKRTCIKMTCLSLMILMKGEKNLFIIIQCHSINNYVLTTAMMVKVPKRVLVLITSDKD